MSSADSPPPERVQSHGKRNRCKREAPGNLFGKGPMAKFEKHIFICTNQRPDGNPRGCFVMGTAVTEAFEDPEIRESVATGLRTIDADFETRLRVARETGELKDDADPAALSFLASAAMQSIAIRARAGVPRAELTELARKSVAIICGQLA